MSIILGKFLVIGPNANQIDRVIAILACREMESDDCYVKNLHRPTTNGPLQANDSQNPYWEIYVAMPKKIYEKKFGPYQAILTNDTRFNSWVFNNGSKPVQLYRSKKTCRNQGDRSVQTVGMPEQVFLQFKEYCAKLGISMSKYIGACICYALDYVCLDKYGNPAGFNELVPLLSAETENMIEKNNPVSDIEMVFPPEKTVRDIIIEYLLTDPTPDEFIAKKTIAERLSMSPQKLWTPENREEYSKWENMFKNLRSGEMEKIYSPAIYAVLKQYFQKKREKFPKKYEIADMLQTTAIKLFNLQTEECENNRKEYDKWKKRFQDGNL